MKDLLFRILLWRLPFLPALSMGQWGLLWALNFAAIICNMVGRMFGWWEADDQLGAFTMFVNILLVLTPLETVSYLIRPKDMPDAVRMMVLRRDARRLIADKDNPENPFEVHRIVVAKGKVIRDERIA